MPQDLADQPRLLNAGSDPQRAAAMRTGLDVDGEHALEALRPGHWGQRLVGIHPIDQGLPRPLTNHTDIYGFIAAAGDAFRERKGTGRELHPEMVTDLKDTVRREEWQRYLLQEGRAASVDVRSANLLPQ